MDRAALCRERIERGLIYLNQPVREFFECCGSVEGIPVGGLQVFNFEVDGGSAGLAFVASDGKIVHAFHWGDSGDRKIYFDGLTSADREALEKWKRLK